MYNIYVFYKKIISPKDLKKTKGQVTDALAKAFVRFYVEKLGSGPKSVRVYFLSDMIIVRLTGRIHPLEEFLLKEHKGYDLVKHIRKTVQEASFKDLNEIIKKIVGCNVVSFHSDSSTKTGERFEIFIVDEDLDNRFKDKMKQ